MKEVLFVAIGGALGSVLRYGVGAAAGHMLGKSFPWGTLAVNVLGCFVMGLVVQVLANLESQLATSPETASKLAFWHKAVAIGFLGGLTTFSSFGADTLREAQAGQAPVALLNVLANVSLSLAAVWAGMAAMKGAG